MNTGAKFRLSVSLLTFAVAQPVLGQAGDVAYSYPRTLASSGMLPAQAEIVREIDDPHTGERWLLTRNPIHPAGPGRLVLVSGFRPPNRPSQPGVEQPHPVIHAGDRLVVEENTAVVEARLEAVALGPALIGSSLDVRLDIGGRVERAVALGPGRAAFMEEARP